MTGFIQISIRTTIASVLTTATTIFPNNWILAVAPRSWRGTLLIYELYILYSQIDLLRGNPRMIDKRLSHILLVLYLFFLTHGDRLVQTKKTCRRKKIDAVGGGGWKEKKNDKGHEKKNGGGKGGEEEHNKIETKFVI